MPLTTLTLGDSSKVQIGQTVIAIGNALGQYKNTVTKGVISGQARTITASDGSGGSETLENVFQTDASINPGNSGGPLLDLDGSVIAMNTAVDSQGQLIGFAIPINVVKKDIEQVDKTGKITQPYLGIRYVMLTKAVAEKNSLPVETGAWIQPSTTESDTPVVKDSPAAKAGIIANDIITSINGTALDDTHSLISILSNYKPGETVTVEYYRGKDKKSVKITLAERPS
jgi:serine protease Do